MGKRERKHTMLSGGFTVDFASVSTNFVFDVWFLFARKIGLIFFLFSCPSLFHHTVHCHIHLCGHFSWYLLPFSSSSPLFVLHIPTEFEKHWWKGELRTMNQKFPVPPFSNFCCWMLFSFCWFLHIYICMYIKFCYCIHQVVSFFFFVLHIFVSFPFFFFFSFFLFVCVLYFPCNKIFRCSKYCLTE